MDRIPKILIILSMNDEGSRKKLAGIFDYIRESGPWDVTLTEPDSLCARARNRPDGIIAGEWTFGATRFADVPKVILHAAGKRLPLASYVTCDNAAVVSAAEDFLRKRGFTSFAYVNDKSLSGSSRNRASLATGRIWPEDGYTDFGDWILSLPQRTAVLTADDTVARDAVLKCDALGIRVPRDLAFVGIDNDELLCESCTTALTSVEPDFRKGGYMAAQRLDALMSGKAPKDGDLLYGVRRIVERDSSRFIRRDEDPRIGRAFLFLRKHATESVGVADVAKAAGVSRRTLENLFKRKLKRSVGTLLRLARLDFIRRQLLETARPVSAICADSGFQSESHAKRAFKAQFGKPMSAFRANGAQTDRSAVNSSTPRSPQVTCRSFRGRAAT